MILKRGDVQLTSAGTGISHSEKAHGASRLLPKYFTRHYNVEEKMDKCSKVVAPVWAEGVKDTREGEGSAPVQSVLTLYSTILGTGKVLSRSLERKKAYVHVIQTSGYNGREASGARVKFSTKGGEEAELTEGDGS